MSDVIGLVVIGIAVVSLVLHVMLAFGVMFDAVALERQRPLWFLGSLSWAVATLITGLIGATAYWLMHHSTIAVERRRPVRDHEAEIPMPHRRAG